MLGKKSVVFFLMALILSVIFMITGCGSAVATVDDMKIKSSEVDEYLGFLKNQLEDEQIEDEEYMKSLESDIIDSLIVVKLLDRYAKENNFSVTDAEIDAEMKTIVESYSSEADFNSDLEAQGVDKDFIEAEIRNQLLRTKIFNEITVDVLVTEDQVKSYYEENKDAVFKVPEKIKVSHILAAFPWTIDAEVEETEEGKQEALEKIKFVQEQLNDGIRFESLATQYSDDETSAENGGDLGYITKGQMVEEFENAAFKLKVDEVSSIVESTYGYHIIKVFDKQDAYIQDFEEVKESIDTYLVSKYKNDEWQSFVYSLIDTAKITYLTENEGSLNEPIEEESDEDSNKENSNDQQEENQQEDDQQQSDQQETDEQE